MKLLYPLIKYVNAVLYIYIYIYIYFFFYLYIISIQAESNVKGVIVSKPSVGTVCYGLVEKGKKQAKDVHKQTFLNQYTLFFNC